MILPYLRLWRVFVLHRTLGIGGLLQLLQQHA